MNKNQAILVTYYPPTESRKGRYRAQCARGSEMVNQDLCTDAAGAAGILTAAFVAKDKAQFGIEPKDNVWAKDLIEGVLPNGDSVFVLA